MTADPARHATQERGEDSALHLVVLDELDAFTRARGMLAGDTSGIRDSVVNQLLAKMDGIEQLQNVLVVGLTNRPELIEPALLRPGRLEVHVEVGLPDRGGRQRILEIHSARLATPITLLLLLDLSPLLTLTLTLTLSLTLTLTLTLTLRLRDREALDGRCMHALDSGALAAATRGFSGAELAGLLRSAASFALERYLDSSARGWAVYSGEYKSSGDGRLEVRWDDLERAFREVRPVKARWGAQATRGARWARVRELRLRTRKYLSPEEGGQGSQQDQERQRGGR